MLSEFLFSFKSRTCLTPISPFQELLEMSKLLAERLQDAVDIALDQGDEDLLTVNVGRQFIDCTLMLNAFESYCIRQVRKEPLIF